MAEQKGSRKIVGLALAGSAVILVIVATLIYTGVFGIDGQGRTLVAGAMGVAAVIDLVLAAYFILSDS